MTKKIFALMLVLILVASISGCLVNGSIADPSDQTEPSTSTPLAVPTSEPWPVHLKKSAVASQPARYIPIGEVSGYSKEIITDELLSKPSTLPDASVSSIPYWTGFVGENMAWVNFADGRWDSLTDGSGYFYEDNIKVLAEEGFNCYRAVYGLSFLSNIDDPQKINETQLECLDELISWGLKYDVHIMISITGLPGKATKISEQDRRTYPNDALLQEKVDLNDELFRNPELAMLYQQYMEMLLTRYKGIPNRNLSFELLAEPAVPEGNVKLYEDVLLPIVKSLKAIDADRILIVNDVWKNIPWRLAEAGCALSLHIHISGVNGDNLKDSYGIDYKGKWPMEFLPERFGDQNDKPLTLVSNEGFKAGTIEVYFCVGKIAIEADGKKILTSGQHDIWSSGDKASGWERVEFPEGTKEIRIRAANYADGLIAVRITQNEDTPITLVSHMMYLPSNELDSMPAILIHPDGQTENIDSPKRTLDAEYMEKRLLQPWIECAKKYNVGFLLTEVGTDTRDLTKEGYTQYESTWLKALKDNRIPWMYNCMHGVYAPEGLLSTDVQYACGFTDIEQVPGTPFEKNIGILDLLKMFQ